MMKLQLSLCVLLVVSCGLARAYNGNGQPGCKTQAELEIGVFRNDWDPTAYWKCESLNKAGSEVRCPTDTAFMDSLKNCVSWDEWEWETPVAPLSEPDQ